MGTSPEIERKRNGAAVLCVILAVLCVAMAGAALYFWHNVAAANARAEQAEAKAEEMAGYCESLIKAGDRVIDEADKQLSEADAELNEYAEKEGLRFGSIYQSTFDATLPQGWNYTVDYVRERMP